MKRIVASTIFIIFLLIGQVVGYSYPKTSEYPWGASPTLTYYIDDENVPSGYHPEYKQIVLDAFNWWEGGGNDKISYNVRFERGNSQDADITVRWIEESGSEVGGQAKMSQIGSLFTKCAIWLELGRQSSAMGVLGEYWKPHSTSDMEVFAKHEVGHCLGLAHSDDSNDLMYPTGSSDPWSTAPAYADFAKFAIPVMLIFIVFWVFRSVFRRRTTSRRTFKKDIVLTCAKCGHQGGRDVVNCPKCGSNVWK